MTCQLYRNLLPLHAGGDLSGMQKLLVEQHLNRCQPCQDEFRALQRSLDACRQVREERELPQDAFDGMWEAIEREMVTHDQEHRRRRRTIIPLSPWQRLGDRALQGLAIAATIFMAVTFGSWMLNDDGPGVLPGTAQPEQAQEAPVPQPSVGPDRSRLATRSHTEDLAPLTPVAHRHDGGDHFQPLVGPRSMRHQGGSWQPPPSRGHIIPTSF